MVVVRLLDAHQHLGGLVGALGGHHVRALGVDLEPHDQPVPVEWQRRVVNKEVAVLAELRVEGQRVQSLFDEPRLHVRSQRVDLGEVEDWLRGDGAVLVDDLDAPHALDDEHAPGPVIGRSDIGGIVESFGDLHQGQLGVARQLDAGCGAGHLIAIHRRALQTDWRQQECTGDRGPEQGR